MQDCCKGFNEYGFRAKEDSHSWRRKENLLNLLDANELVNKVKVENIMLLDKIKNLEQGLSVTRE